MLGVNTAEIRGATKDAGMIAASLLLTVWPKAISHLRPAVETPLGECSRMLPTESSILGKS